MNWFACTSKAKNWVDKVVPVGMLNQLAVLEPKYLRSIRHETHTHESHINNSHKTIKNFSSACYISEKFWYSMQSSRIPRYEINQNCHSKGNGRGREFEKIHQENTWQKRILILVTELGQRSGMGPRLRPRPKMADHKE